LNFNGFHREYFGEICYSQEKDLFFFFDHADPSSVFEECELFQDFAEVLNRIIEMTLD